MLPRLLVQTADWRAVQTQHDEIKVEKATKDALGATMWEPVGQVINREARGHNDRERALFALLVMSGLERDCASEP